MELNEQTIVGQIVANNYRTATVFNKYKIDFCCKGDRSLQDVCTKSNLQVDTIIKELANCRSTESTEDFESWDADLLVDYIIKKHHRYVESKIPEILSYIIKVSKVHGERHPEVVEIANLFSESASALLHHMHKEEKILFPYILELSSRNPVAKPVFNTIENPVNMMKDEHEQEGERFRQIATLSNEYTPPADACTTYRVAYSILQEFEADLHKHIHLENNILFPKAIALEEKSQKQPINN